MLKSRQEIKAHAKAAMKEQRGVSILAPLVFIAIAIVGGLFGLIPAIGLLLVYATLFFIDFPLAVNLEGMFVKIYNREQTSVGEMFEKLQVNYLRKVGGMAWMTLFVFLWFLLFFIPGFVKAIAYSMTPFILATCPNVKAKDALKLSMRMTKGHKGKLFVMMLSFIGWLLLGGLTLHILTVVFVMPYYYTTWAGYFTELKNNAIETGVISAEELQ